MGASESSGWPRIERALIALGGITLLCGTLVCAIPGWREVARIDVALLFPLPVSGVMLSGLGHECLYKDKFFPFLDNSSRHGEFNDRDPDSEWVTAAADRWVAGNPTAEDRRFGKVIAINDAISRCFSPYPRDWPSAPAHIKWAQQEEPNNGFLWLAEDQLRWNLRHNSEAGNEPRDEAKDMEELTRRLPFALSKQPWDAHAWESCRARAEALVREGAPRLEVARDYCNEHFGSDIEFAFRYLPEWILKRGVESRDPEVLARMFELAVEFGQVQWVGASFSPPLLARPDSGPFIRFTTLADGLAAAAHELDGEPKPVAADLEGTRATAVAFAKRHFSERLVNRLIADRPTPFERPHSLPIVPAPSWYPLEKSFAAQLILVVALLAFSAIALPLLLGGQRGQTPTTVALKALILPTFCVATATWLVARSIYPFTQPRCGGLPYDRNPDFWWTASPYGVVPSLLVVLAVSVVCGAIWFVRRSEWLALPMAALMIAATIGIAVQAHERESALSQTWFRPLPQ